MGLFGNKPAKRMQLYHHDNGDLECRRLKIVGQSATEFNDRNEPVRAWYDLFQSLYPFNGYKSIPADGIQLAYSRNYHLEIHPILKGEFKPPEDGTLINPFLTLIAELRAFLLAKAKKPKSLWDKLTIILGLAVVMEMIIWGIMAYVSK
jgi:hypothetical protein